MPEEVMALPPSTAITFTPGVPPIRTTLLSILEDKWLTRPPGFIRRSLGACRVFAASLALFLATSAFAFALTIAVKDEPWARQVTPPEVREWLDSIGPL
jgi:type IV secretion system protein VirD4